MRRARRTVLLVVAVFAIVAMAAVAAAAIGEQRPAQVTTAPPAASTLAPTTVATTTVATSTTELPTTTEPATTTPSSTTPSSTTTTTVPTASTSSGSGSAPWGWIIAILAVIAVALIIVLVLLRRSSNSTKSEWKDSAASALRDADLARDILADEARPGDPEDATRVTAVRDTIERVASQFDQLAASAPNDDMRRSSIAMASSLRGYFFALEAEQMMHNAPTTPTADQLGTADATKRARAAELEAAATAIRTYVAPKA
jgi:hypothetical protein